MAKLKLSQLLIKIAESGAEASISAAEQSRRHMLDLFEETEDGDYTPKMVKLTLNGVTIDVPKITLLPASDVRFQSMKMAFAASVDVEKDGTATLFNHFNLFQRTVDVKVQMAFSSTDPPEGFALICNALQHELGHALETIKHEKEDTHAG